MERHELQRIAPVRVGCEHECVVRARRIVPLERDPAVRAGNLRLGWSRDDDKSEHDHSCHGDEGNHSPHRNLLPPREHWALSGATYLHG